MSVQKLAVDGFDEVHRVECAGSVAFVAIHALLCGRSFGGVRIRAYATEDDALTDALALARAMSRKVVMAGIAGGGAKAVLMQPSGDRAAAVRQLGEFIESLGGRYLCGPDYGFTAADETVLRSATRHVASGNLAPATARSVIQAMRAVCEPRVVAVQGLGAVGLPLARTLRDAGVRVVATDLRPVEGFETVLPEAIYGVECDVFAPCATGGVLNSGTIPRLRCRVVCGAANNPLASDEDAELLLGRGIVYVPDFLANCGATIQGASTALGETHLIGKRMAAVADVTRALLREAEATRSSPHHVALAWADREIARLRAGPV